jgi:uncharacterized protein YmfQ (DUF2313 family)
VNEADVDRLAAVLLELRPPGPLYRSPVASTFRGLTAAIAAEGVRFRDRVLALVEVEADPQRATETLEDWERWLGLPDPALPADLVQTTVERRNAVVARLRAIGGQSVQYFLDVAAELGFTIQITELDRALCGSWTCSTGGYTFMGGEWEYVWIVHAPEIPMTFARCGASRCGDPIATFGGPSQLLESVIRRVAPAHTIPIFLYDL